MNEITIRKETAFKSPDLNNAVKSFDKFFSGINKNWRDACILMHRLADGKKYELDGFKSVADFAETIGIEKSTAHKMADAGMVYDSKNPVVAQFADKAGYTKASKVASIVKEGKETDLAKAIEEGEISADDSVSEIASWKATKALQSKPEKVVPTWDIVGHALRVIRNNDGDITTEYSDIDVKVGIEKPIDWAREYDSTAIASTVKDIDGTVYYFGLTSDGSMFTYTATKLKKEAKPVKKAKKSLDDMTPDELQAWAKSKGLNITFSNATES